MPDATMSFKQRLREAFAQIQVGQTFTYRRTFGEGDVALFCGVTGDFNPYHQDELFAGESWFGRRIVPGLLTASMITHIGGMMGFLAANMTFEYTAPVYIGDTISCTVTITEKVAEKRRVLAEAYATNQDGLCVLTGHFSGFPAQIRLSH
jgi:acyl dehydratase